MKPIYPGQIIGIIGAGQLGEMMALEAIAMGYIVHTYDPNPAASAHRIAQKAVIKAFDDAASLIAFCAECAVITYEFENVDNTLLEQIQQHFNCPQGSKALIISSHRWRELGFARQQGIPTLNSIVVHDRSDLSAASKQLGFPFVLKTCTQGYDGHGQQRIDTPEDFIHLSVDEELLAQQWLIAIRSRDGIHLYPPFANHHKKGILAYTQVPAPLDSLLQKHLEAYTLMLIENLDYIGCLAVEYFVQGGQIYFNEMAPRPHNSGHCTLEASNKSQFKAHIEAVCGLAVGELKHLRPALMVNILGQHYQRARDYLFTPDYQAAFFHDYLKPEIRMDRKMAHMTFCSESAWHDGMRFYERIEKNDE